MSGLGASAATVYAVVVTYNRRDLLLQCLESLADQTHPLAGVLVIDNASTDGTLELLLECRPDKRLRVDYLRLARNGGGAEGFHYGLRHARYESVDWIWLMDDDCEARPSALEDLLAHPRALDPDTVLLAPVITDELGEVLPLNRGWMRSRWFIAPLVGLRPEHYAMSEVELEHCSLVGPLVRTSAAASVDPPRRELFIWWDDLEWTSRLRQLGDLWLVPASRMIHRDTRPLVGAGWRARWRDLLSGDPFPQLWKRSYGLRNLIFCGRRDGYITAGQAASYTVVAGVRALASPGARWTAVRLLIRYARWGWQGIFLNVPPAEWAGLARGPDPVGRIERQALSYGGDVDGQPQALAVLAAGGSPPAKGSPSPEPAS